MKIAFTSCCDPWNDPIQAAWTHLVAKNPDVLVLLGDNIYMDYGLGKNPYGLYDPKCLSDIDFAKVMHGNYAKQWAVPNFQSAINTPSIKQIHAIWDDHDFAWNNSRGAGSDNGAKELVSKSKRDISITLFKQFRTALITKPIPNQYPSNPYLNGFPANLTNLPNTGIEKTVPLSGNIHLHLLDGRSFRPEPDKTKSLLGENQQTKLAAALSTPNIIHLIASGTTLKDWKSYNDKDWLKAIAKNQNIIVLSGDIHEPAIYHRNRIFEFTASAMAQPAKITGIFGKESNVFGIIEIQDTTIAANIYQWNIKKQELVTRKSAEIDRNNWVLTGISGKSNEYSDTE